MSKQKEQLILVFSRFNLNPLLIPPFKIILPTLSLIAPLRIFTSLKKQITTNEKSANLYEALIYHLENEEGDVSLNDTLKIILEIVNSKNTKQCKKNYRICIVGEQIADWDIVMAFKKKGIILDTAGQNKRLQQISFVTKGINRVITPQNICRHFFVIFSLNTETRKKFNFQQQQNIQFTLDCKCCTPSKELKNQCYICSKCLTVHCSKMSEKCVKCGQLFQD